MTRRKLRNAAPLLAGLLVGLCCGSLPAPAGWREDPAGAREQKTARAVARFEERMPRLQKYFDSAHGYAILPTVTRVGFGFGGAYGRGLVVEGDAVVGSTQFFQVTSGIQAGARVFRMIVFFKNAEALEYFKRGRLEFIGQASASAGPYGTAADPAYNSGVAVFTLTKAGLMVEASISGGKFSFKPAP
jgi:lipid-binding SYLF domain-containing protein